MPTRDELRARIAAFLKQPVERLSDELALADLVVESLMLVELAIDLQEDYGVRLGHEELARVATVGDLVSLLAGDGSG